MTITNPAQLLDALGNNFSRILIDKASIANQLAGRAASLWRATGQPAQGAIPTAAAIPTSATLGAVSFTNQTAPNTSYVGMLGLTSANNTMGFEIHDRIAHMGGLVLNVTTPQAIAGMDLLTLAVPAARLGEANYSDVTWWLEVYTDGGATASNATITCTFDDASSANLAVQAVGGTLRAGMLIPLTPLIQAAQQGLFIRGITNVTLSASTTVAGNFGFTATRLRSTLGKNYIANKPETYSWVEMGMPNVPNDSCLQLIAVSPNTSTGILRGGGKIVHG
jgi:hypothetical protein